MCAGAQPRPPPRAKIRFFAASGAGPMITIRETHFSAGAEYETHQSVIVGARRAVAVAYPLEKAEDVPESFRAILALLEQRDACELPRDHRPKG